jgi:hypothetical protein
LVAVFVFLLYNPPHNFVTGEVLMNSIFVTELVYKINNIFGGKFMCSSNDFAQAAVINADSNESAPLMQRQAEESGYTPAALLAAGAIGAAFGGLGIAGVVKFGLIPLASTTTPTCMATGSIASALTSSGCVYFFAGNKHKPEVDQSAAAQSSEALQPPAIRVAMARD